MTPGTYAPFAPTEAFMVGLHNIFERNGIVFNDLALMETYVVDDVTGFERPDGQLANEPNTSSHGESFVSSFWGGRTMTLSGYIKAGTYTTAMNMGEALRISLATRQEMPLKIKTAPGSVLQQETYIVSCQPADFTIDPKPLPSDIKGEFRRPFSVSFRASYPFYERDNVVRSNYNWTGQPYMSDRNVYDVSGTMGTTANGPGTVPVLGIPGYRVAANPTTVANRIAGPVSTSSQDWMPCAPGEQVFGSCDVYVATAIADLSAYTEILWRDASGNIIGSASSANVGITVAGATTTLTCTGVAPVGTAYASRASHMRRTSTGLADVWFTRMWTGVGSTYDAGSYKDGNSVGWMWVGEPGQSFSRPDGSTTFELIPTTVSIPGRPYDRVYDLGYTELMDQNGNLVTTGPNTVNVLTSGTGDARMVITMSGPMSGILLVNETTEQAMWFTDIPVNKTVKVYTDTGEVFDELGNERPSLLDPRSDYIHIAGKRDGRSGLNKFVLYVQDYDVGAKFFASFRKTHF